MPALLTRSWRLRCKNWRSGRDRGGGAARVEGVAEAADGVDQVALDFLAEAQDVNVDGAVGNRPVLAPHGVEQLLAAEDDAWATHQEFEEPEFGGSQGERHAVEPHLAAGGIELETRGLKSARLRDGPLLGAELEFDARDQLADKERLHHVVIGAELKADDAVGFRRAGGQENDGSGAEIRVLADPFAEVEAVGIGQHDVEEYEVGAHLPAELDCAASGL